MVSSGRLGDMFGRVQIYNAGFVVFTSRFDPACRSSVLGGAGAMWLIGWRVVQAIGGSMLTANSVAILTDAFPADSGASPRASTRWPPRRQVRRAGGRRPAGRVDWRAVFWVNVPVGIFGTLWAYRKLRDNGDRAGRARRLVGQPHVRGGLGAMLIGVTVAFSPTVTPGLDNPAVIGLLLGGVSAGRSW